MSKWSRTVALRKALPLLLTISLGLLVVLTACHPGSIDSIEQADIVVTNYDTDAQFGALHTYVLDNDVHEIRDPDSNEPEYDGRYNATILGEIKTNMDALGYVQIDSNGVDRTDSTTWPNMWVRSVLVSATNVVLYSYYPGYPGWGWGWYYPSYGTFTYRSGSVFVDMFDLTRAVIVNPDSLIAPIAWNGILNGVVEGSTAQINQRIDNSINQMFRQSPYLGYQGN